MTSNNDVTDVLVVGAGLAGLLTAYRLKQAGMTVKILEIRPRLGGRMAGVEVGEDKAWVDLGGQWLGPTQYLMLELLEELGIQKFDYAFKAGVTRLEWKGKRADFAGDMYFAMLPSDRAGDSPTTLASQEEIEDAKQAWQKMEEIMKGFSPGKYPYTHPRAAELDAHTMHSWLQQNTKTDFAKFFYSYCCRSLGPIGPSSPSSVSILHFCWTQYSAPQKDMPESYLIHGGAGQIPSKLADLIGQDNIELGQDVVAITKKNGVAVVTTRQGGSFVAHRVVVSAPPSVAHAIVYEPALTARRHQLMQRASMGTIAKVLLAYDSKFWHGDDKTVALCVSTSTRFAGFTADASDPTKKTGILVAFVEGEKYFEWKDLPQEEQMPAVLKDLVHLYGPKAANPVSVVIGDWPEDQYAGGGYGGQHGPGVWTQFGPTLEKPEWGGVLDFCGTEYALQWSGFFEGAAISAKAVTDRILILDH
jgi:monoamine oxidase